MKTPLLVLSLFTTVAVPGVLAVEIAGLSLPPSFNAGSVFGLFVVALIALTAVSDYARARQPRLVESPALAKSPHPLAA